MGRSETEREISVVELVAEAINLSEGTDYRAQSCELEFPDAKLVSDSGRYATRQAEVVSTPQDFTIRPDNKNARYFERTLYNALDQLGVLHCQVTVKWTESALRYGTDDHLMKRLAEILAHETPAEGHLWIGGEELYEHSPQVAEIVNYVNIYRFDFLAPTLASNYSCWPPQDAQWLEAALAKKLRRYGGRTANGMMLVIDFLVPLGEEQMAAFRASKRSEEIPFDEVWVVSMRKANRLKP